MIAHRLHHAQPQLAGPHHQQPFDIKSALAQVADQPAEEHAFCAGKYEKNDTKEQKRQTGKRNFPIEKGECRDRAHRRRTGKQNRDGIAENRCRTARLIDPKQGKENQRERRGQGQNDEIRIRIGDRFYRNPSGIKPNPEGDNSGDQNHDEIIHHQQGGEQPRMLLDHC